MDYGSGIFRLLNIVATLYLLASDIANAENIVLLLLFPKTFPDSQKLPSVFLLHLIAFLLLFHPRVTRGGRVRRG